MALTPRGTKVTILSMRPIDGGEVFVKWADGIETYVTVDFLTPENDEESRRLGVGLTCQTQ